MYYRFGNACKLHMNGYVFHFYVHDCCFNFLIKCSCTNKVLTYFIYRYPVPFPGRIDVKLRVRQLFLLIR